MAKKQENKFDIARIDAQLKIWRERLLDLSKGNPLLGINRSRVSKLRVVEPSPDQLFNLLVLEAKTLNMPLIKRKAKRTKGTEEEIDVREGDEPEYIVEPGDINFDAKPKDLHRLMRRIYDNGRTTVEERGVTTLHLTFGLLEWDDPNLGESLSPLLLVPCQLESRGPNSHMRLKMTDEELQLNPALELYLRERHHLELPQLGEEQQVEFLRQFLAQVKEETREQHWQVLDECWLSTFSFESLVIYKDLGSMVEIAHQNPVIAALARAGSIPIASEALGENLDEDDIPTVVPVPVMTADASQLRALAIASAGHHLVVHGPPGTGKSQTITNLIADALGRDKTVLFVSAKMAALNVVYDRLAKLDLDRYCLEAHSTKAGKAKIIEELKRTLELPISNGGETTGEQIDIFKKLRSQLNDYVKELHTKRDPLRLTIYEAIGKIAKLQKLPSADFDLPWKDVLSVTQEELSEKKDILENLAAHAEVFDHKSTHPWRGLLVEKNHSTNTDEVKKNLQIISNCFQEFQKHLAGLAELLMPVESSFTFANLKNLSHVLEMVKISDGLPAKWTSQKMDKLRHFQDLFESAFEMAKKYETTRGEYTKITSLPTKKLINLLEPLSSEFASWTRIFKVRFWKWRVAIRQNLSAAADNSYSALQSYVNMAKELEEIESWFSSKSSDISQYYVDDPLFDLQALGNIAIQFKTALHIRQAVTDKIIRMPTEIIALSSDHQKIAYKILELINNQELLSALTVIDAKWPTGFVDGLPIGQSGVASVVSRSREILAALPRIHEWVVLHAAEEKCNSANLGQLLTALMQTGAKDAVDIFQKRFFSLWVQAALDSNPALREFIGITREEQIAKFRELDRKLRISTLRGIQRAAALPAQDVLGAQNYSGGSSEVGILRKELQKRRRIKPLRKLFSEIPHVLQAIKPCMLMSPISVSTFLRPGSITFDLVVFDEASQLPPQEAIPSILRAEQVVVAGDQNQLPPTTFFWASSIFEEEGEVDSQKDLEPLESLLDDCVAISPLFAESKIIWHYRSKDERLIKFSNHYFYNNQLITFPSATTDHEGRGVHLVYTSNGIWDRGRSRTNRIEAQRVAQLVVEQLERYPERSLGVVAMNANQKEAIEYALDDLLATRPDLISLLNANKAEPFFVKSLENVQGDERDTIVISIGYAKTIEGALSLNFGPLNREGGWRRLNVLITRAKWQTILVTSLRSPDLGGIKPGNRGALMLRNFIEYAEEGAQLPSDPTILSDYETNDFEDAVAARLRDRRLTVDEQVGSSGYRIDLAIRDARDNNRYVMAVECDGATYHSTKTARDRDILRHEVLRSQGWKIYRLWSTDWFRNPEKAIEGILNALKVALRSPADESVEAPPIEHAQISNPGQIDDPEGIESVKVLANSNKKFRGGMPYEKFTPNGKRYNSKNLLRKSRVFELAGMVMKIVDHESPIHQSYLIKRLKNIYGLSRAGSNIERNVSHAIKLLVDEGGYFKSKDGFIYKKGRRTDGFRLPSADAERTLDQIPPEEIENAVLYLVEDQFGFTRKHVGKAILEIFGLGRNRTAPMEIIESAVDRLIEQGKLNLNGHTLYIN